MLLISMAPSSTGIEVRSISTRTFEATTISLRWPARPNPVTSVHAVALCLSAASIPTRFSLRIESMAPSIHSPRHMPLISAARRTPVPSALVRISFCPTMRFAFFSTAPPTLPVTAKPSAISSPCAECPPLSSQSASAKVMHAPESMCSKQSLTLSALPRGTTATASAALGLTPIA